MPETFAFTIRVLGASLSHGDSNESEEDDSDGKREPHFVDLNASFSDAGNVGASECLGQLWGTGPGSQTLITCDKEEFDIFSSSFSSHVHQMHSKSDIWGTLLQLLSCAPNAYRIV